MKRSISLLIMSLFFLSISISGLCDDTFKEEFVITKDGEITAYYGESWVVVPEIINGIEVKRIGDETFFDLGIEDIYIVEGPSSIGESAFEGSNIISADIPSSLKDVGDRAFANCAYLRTVFINFNEHTTLGEDVFSGTGHLIFYITCNTDEEAMREKITKAKGDRNYEIMIRHCQYEYDSEGNGLCGYCGYTEGYDEFAFPFTDVPLDSWYYKYVYEAYTESIINGKSETIFDPDAGMTCAEAAKIAACIYALYSDSIPEYTTGPWYQPYVDYCYDMGLMEEHIVFDWESNITRAQMAYLFSHCDFYDDYLNDVPITDIGDVSYTTPFAYEIIDLYNRGVAVGDQNMLFYPDSHIKRCEAAAIVARILNWNMRIELPKG